MWMWEIIEDELKYFTIEDFAEVIVDVSFQLHCSDWERAKFNYYEISVITKIDCYWPVNGRFETKSFWIWRTITLTGVCNQTSI